MVMDEPAAKRARETLEGADDGSFFSRVRFAELVTAKDSVGIHAELRKSEERRVDEEGGAVDVPIVGSSAPATASNYAVAVGADVTRASRAGPDAEDCLEALCAALKKSCFHYSKLEEPSRWMVIPLLWFVGRPRRVAMDLDRAGRTDRHRKKLVEVLRESFQQLHREYRRKDAGCLAVCCELLRLYFSLGQASQCSFLLAAVTKAQKSQELDLQALPKTLAVSLCYLWGKHCVIDGNVTEAHEKLSWALTHCPQSAVSNRRRILDYLVPCKLRLGQLPRSPLLSMQDCGPLAGIAQAVRQGDVQTFNLEIEKQEQELIRAGTYLFIEKLRLLAYRNLSRRVHAEVAADTVKAGRADHRHKQALLPYEIAFAWQDGFDADEAVCMIAHLIYIGAIRGYMSDEHRMVVFSKETPFPSTSSGWFKKA